MKRILPYIALIAVFIAFSFWFLAIKNGFMLRWYDEMSLFEPGTAGLRQFLHYPGGLFRFAGTYLTQFLFYPALGAGILILIWLLCAWLTKVSFGFAKGAVPLCFLIPLCLLASILHFDEACLTFESQGYVFYNTLGFTFSLAAYALFVAFHRNIYAQGALAVVLPCLYPLAGFFALLPAVMCLICMGIQAAKGRKPYTIAAALLSLLLVVVVPPIYYRYFNGTTVDNDWLFLKGLPELTMHSYDWYLWRPFAFASLLLIVFVLISAFVDHHKYISSIITKWTSLGLFLVGIILCFSADSRKSEQLRATVLMVKAIEEKDWRKAVHIMSLVKESPNYTMCVLDNLARAYSGLERRSVGNMSTVSTDFRHDEDFTIKAFVNVPVNHNIGRFNQSHRWATENNVLYGNRVYFIKYIVLNALMNGELDFARKFNRLLMRTTFHRQWAEDINRYIDNPDLINTITDFDMLVNLRHEEIMRGE